MAHGSARFDPAPQLNQRALIVTIPSGQGSALQHSSSQYVDSTDAPLRVHSFAGTIRWQVVQRQRADSDASLQSQQSAKLGRPHTPQTKQFVSQYRMQS